MEIYCSLKNVFFHLISLPQTNKIVTEMFNKNILRGHLKFYLNAKAQIFSQEKKLSKGLKILFFE
jgi:hypothetical protein